MICPKCKSHNVDRPEVDIGVGIQYGPYICSDCGWEEDQTMSHKPEVKVDTSGIPEKTDKEKFEAFTRELAVIINKHSVDNEMAVPDYILSVFIVNTLLSLKQTMAMMKDFYEQEAPPMRTDN